MAHLLFGPLLIRKSLCFENSYRTKAYYRIQEQDGVKKTIMPLERYFIDWKQPLLWSAVDWLAEHYRSGRTWDLSRCIIVLPSSMAGRRLMEYLAVRADQESWNLLPPQVCTLGALPEQLYRAQRPIASDMVQALVWTEALLHAPAAALEAWLLQIPDKSRIDEWLELAKNLATMHRELASDDLDFAAVAKWIEQENLAPLTELKRWQSLALLQKDYWKRLDRLELWDAQTARRVALQKKELHCTKEIISLGNVDLNLIQKRLLQEVDARVVVLVGAPEKWSSGFDTTGGLIAKTWQGIEIPIEDSQIDVAGNPADQAAAVADTLDRLLERFQSHEITVGVPDSNLIPYMRFQFDQSKLAVRYGPGHSVTESPPFKLLVALTSFLQADQYTHWASLLRQPAVESYLRSKLNLPDDWLIQIDRFYHETLQREVPSDKSPHPEKRYADCRPLTIQVADCLKELVLPLRGSARPVREWVQPAVTFFQKLLADFDWNSNQANEHVWSEGCAILNDLFCTANTIPSEIQLPLACAEWFRWLLRQAGAIQISEPPIADAIEMLGWLELVLDDAPALVLTGMSLNVVPDSSQGDTFLPNQLRTALGLIDNDRRWARDAYALMVATQSREELRFVVGRIGIDGEPVMPSRLLFTTTTEHIGSRVNHLLKVRSRSGSDSKRRSWQPLDEDALFPIPEIVEPRIPTVLSVTDFKSYMVCPYRYYLDRLLRLEELDDRPIELDARRFGTLVHDCLDKLIDDQMKSCRDADKIFLFLKRHLDTLVRERFGATKSAALEIQVAQAEQRLLAFAAVQAERAAEGWTILHTELKIEEGDAFFPVEGEEPMKLKGRIDRIDYHPMSEKMAIWDYKTSDSYKDPLAAHYSSKKDEWYDLQLPLYRHMIEKFRKGKELVLGYITLPRKLSEIKFRIAEFEKSHFESADRKATEIIRNIRAGKFGPPVFPAPFPTDPYAAICQNDILRRGPLQEVKHS